MHKNASFLLKNCKNRFLTKKVNSCSN